MWKNTEKQDFKYGHFSRSVEHEKKLKLKEGGKQYLIESLLTTAMKRFQ